MNEKLFNPWGPEARVLVILLALGAALRLALLVDFLRSNPSAYAVGGDAAFYWDQAGRFAEGTWLADTPFLSAPLYPFLLGGLRRAGAGLTAVYFVQVILHLLTAWILAFVAGLRSGKWASVVVASMFLLLDEPAFSLVRVLPTTLQLALVATVLFLAARLVRKPGLTSSLGLGASVGLLALAYPPAIVLIPFAGLWIWSLKPAADPSAGRRSDGHADCGKFPSVAPRPPNPTQGLAYSGASVLAGLLMILPATLHNYLACGEFIPITAHAGITFRLGNIDGAEGTYTAVPGVRTFKATQHHDTARVYTEATGRSGSFRDVDRFFLRQGMDYLREDPGRAVVLMARKLYWFLTGRYYSDIYFPRLEQRDGWLHVAPLSPVPTAWLMGPALLGLWLGFRRPTFTAWEPILVVLALLVVLAFYYTPRYRVPAIPALCLAAALALVSAWQAAVRSPRAIRVALAVVLLLALSISTGTVNRVLGFDDLERYRWQFECNKGQTYAQLGRYEDALRCYQMADQFQSDEPVVLAAMAAAFIQLDRLEEARATCERLLKAAPQTLAAWLHVGTVHLRAGESAASEQAFRQAATLDPLDADAQLGLWFALTSQGRTAEGRAHLERAVELDPRNPVGLAEYGILLAESGQPDGGLALLDRAVRLTPDHGQVHYNRGLVLQQLGRLREASAALQETLRLDPTHHAARDALQRLLQLNVDPQRAADALRARIALDPEDPRLYSELAGMLFRQADQRGAVETLRDAVKIGVADASLRLELAWLLATTSLEELADPAEALDLLVEETTTSSPAVHLDVYAAALARAGRYEEAVTQAERASVAAQADGQQALAEAIRERGELYRTGRPYVRSPDSPHDAEPESPASGKQRTPEGMDSR